MRDLAIVTSCAGYGIYLAEWARSIAAQSSLPGEVAIVTHGSEADRLAGIGAKQILEAAGIRTHLEWHRERQDFGWARNRAVSLTTAPWVMHLDADDELLPHALCDVAAIAPAADVVSMGYQRSGDLKAGPANPRRLYRDTTGLEALDEAGAASGVSPFRRSFWERSPYRQDMMGAWDTALWIGFARLGARFRGTRRPGFLYRQHADSIFNTRRLAADWRRAHVEEQLKGLRRDDRGVSVIVPFDLNPERPEELVARGLAWSWLAERYRMLHPEWEVLEGSEAQPGAPWRKSAAVEAAVARSRGAILVIADADCVVAPAALEEAVAAVAHGAPWAIPHGMVHRMGEADTQRWLLSPPDRAELAHQHPLIRQAYQGYAGGGLLVVRKDRWLATGGIPSAFEGWGCEDEALACVLRTLLGEPVRFDYPLFHLWHPAGRRAASEGYQRNRRRLMDFRAAEGNVEAIWAMVAGEGKPGQGLKPWQAREIRKAQAQAKPPAHANPFGLAARQPYLAQQRRGAPAPHLRRQANDPD